MGENMTTNGMGKNISEKFVNPYNFIPFPQKRARAYEDTDKHTGVITYSITTKTPLFIPNTSNENTFPGTEDKDGKIIADHKSYDFFSYNELENGVDYRKEYFEPVIPGSELRGMIRNLYETLTASCMSVFNDGVYPERRTGDVFLPGLIHRTMEDGNIVYDLYKVKAYACIGASPSDDVVGKYNEGQLLYFTAGKHNRRDIAIDITDNEREASEKVKKGYLIKGMPFETKKAKGYLFEESDRKKKVRRLTKEDLKRIEAVLDAYQAPQKEEKPYKDYKEQWENFFEEKVGTYFPIRYSVVDTEKDNFLYLSPAAITREIANTPLRKFLGDFSSCETFRDCCPACNLFGMTGKTNEDAIGSKVRFSDARVMEDREYKEYYETLLVREILGSPKLSNPEFYLVKPAQANMWNYDYYVKYDYYEKKCKIYSYTDENPLKLRGRKYYYHQADVVFPKYVEPSNLNATIRPLKKDVVFQGKLFFENISKKQLSQLLWILNGGSKEDTANQAPLCYKLGSGKPLGFGSVELKVESCQERIISLGENTLQYQEKNLETSSGTYEKNGFCQEIKDDFIAISTLNYVSAKEVSYPYVIDSDGNKQQIGTTVINGYEWFGENKNSGKKIKERCKSKIKKTLPTIQEKYLETYIKTDDEKSSEKKGNKPRNHSGKGGNHNNKNTNNRKNNGKNNHYKPNRK